ncbi:hypothetical protein [Acidovorax sp. PRC11]|uniref:hypothetical protein n=1 Tax=Acidovorax sp. PRC11 TaxID=2962592 RepID=UPI002880DBF3|nr:hypothetical protein [Acidovorax sp. PRC11]MDT0137215.1 hypothetical protein [Acidovorax sp. PRC11]
MNIIEKFIEDCISISHVYRIHSNELIQEEEFLGLINDLHQIGHALRKESTIPKNLAAILFDLSTAFYSSIDWMNDEEKGKTMRLFDKFCDAAREAMQDPSER